MASTNLLAKEFQENFKAEQPLEKKLTQTEKKFIPFREDNPPSYKVTKPKRSMSKLSTDKKSG